MSQPLRIVRLRAENFKRLRAVEITPTGNMVRITGANGAGKTSILDSIMAAIGGRAKAPPKPIRDGADQAVIEIDLGKYIVTRLFTREDKQPPIVVRPKAGKCGLAGKPIRSAQDLLDEMVGDLTFNPLAFARMAPKAQYEELRRIAKIGPEMDEIDRLNAVDYAERTTWNRLAKEAKITADGIDVPEDLPAERLNVAMLADEMDKASQHNALIEKRKTGRGTATERMSELRQRSAKALADLPASLAAIEKRRDERITALMLEIAKVRQDAVLDLAAAEKSAQESAEQFAKDADAIQLKLDQAEALPEPKHILAFKEQIANAQSLNSGIELRERRADKLAEAVRADDRSRRLTRAMEERTLKKQTLIAAAAMPVPDLGLEDGVVMYQGVPFEQASSAEQLRVSVAIAMAANPTLRILRIPDGSLLDSKSMAILAEMAKDNDFQVWIESVDESGKIGVVLEDGAVVADNQAIPDDDWDARADREQREWAAETMAGPSY